ncbi:uncharacterized protein CLUP02_08083 [Colletotrichum lupini]|uniref:Uncharacterized protein n=1 Tax=Colletotrichum lupini TaxID=145971 RepID=A0A9Q8SSV6_9PEZI|nr:uncharacterized protein CLUP02_08083 [Colletotrichum lupini]UQC82593.1 hypothetical protein CLUP02_08083 [Colletotrichum lupini]
MATIKSVPLNSIANDSRQANNGPEKRTILIWRSWAEQGCHVCLRRLPQHVENTQLPMDFKRGQQANGGQRARDQFIATVTCLVQKLVVQNAQILGCGFDARVAVFRRGPDGKLGASRKSSSTLNGGGKARRGEVPECNHFLPWVEEDGRFDGTYLPSLSQVQGMSQAAGRTAGCGIQLHKFTSFSTQHPSIHTCGGLHPPSHGTDTNGTSLFSSFSLAVSPARLHEKLRIQWLGNPCSIVRPFLETRESHLVLNVLNVSLMAAKYWKQVSVSHTHLTPASVSQLDQSAVSCPNSMYSNRPGSLSLTGKTLVVITFKIDLSSISPYHYDTLFTHQDLHLPPASLCKSVPGMVPMTSSHIGYLHLSAIVIAIMRSGPSSAAIPCFALPSGCNIDLPAILASHEKERMAPIWADLVYTQAACRHAARHSDLAEDKGLSLFEIPTLCLFHSLTIRLPILNRRQTRLYQNSVPRFILFLDRPAVVPTFASKRTSTLLIAGASIIYEGRLSVAGYGRPSPSPPVLGHPVQQEQGLVLVRVDRVVARLVATPAFMEVLRVARRVDWLPGFNPGRTSAIPSRTLYHESILDSVPKLHLPASILLSFSTCCHERSQTLNFPPSNTRQESINFGIDLPITSC